MPPPLKMQIFKVVLAISSVQLAVARDLGASFDDYVDTLGQLNEDPWQGDFRGLFRASGGPSVGPTEAEPTAKPTAKPTAEPEPEPTTTEPSEGPFNPDPSGGPAVELPDPITVKAEHKAVHGPTKFVRLQYNAMSFDALNKDKAVQAQLQKTTKETMINANPAVSLFYTLDVNFHASEGRRLTSSGRRLTSSAGVIIETAMVQKNLTGTNVSAADLDSFSSGFSADIGGALTANIASSVDVSALLKDGHAELGVPHVTVFVAAVGSDTATATSQIVPPTAPPTTAAPATTAAPPAPPTTAAPAPATTAAPAPPAPATSAALPGTTAGSAETTPAPETAAPSPTPPVVPVPDPTPTTDVDEDDSALSLRLLWAVGAMMAPYLMI